MVSNVSKRKANLLNKMPVLQLAEPNFVEANGLITVSKVSKTKANLLKSKLVLLSAD